ncbi:hypothetical protein [Pseudoroseomonas sp. WGS1072]|uniref:hypothetical protein n=1 Tax=Roseomonas sp. WGS1072 TaxID=3366816 RepID=UPI003BF235B3
MPSLLPLQELNHLALRTMFIMMDECGPAAMAEAFGIADADAACLGALWQQGANPCVADLRCIVRPAFALQEIVFRARVEPGLNANRPRAINGLRLLHARYLDLALPSWRSRDAAAFLLYGIKPDFAAELQSHPGLRAELECSPVSWLHVREDLVCAGKDAEQPAAVSVVFEAVGLEPATPSVSKHKEN